MRDNRNEGSHHSPCFTPSNPPGIASVIMNFVNGVLFVLATANVIIAKVELYKGTNQTITFKGEEVEIWVDNSKGSNVQGELVICFGAAPDTSLELCPKGYASFFSGFNSDVKKHIFKVNRQGRISEDSYPLSIAGAIKFNDDGSLNILVNKLPVGATVVLPNAKKWAPKEPEKAKESKESTSNTTAYTIIGVVFGIGLLISAVVGIVICLCVIWKKNKAKKMPLAAPPNEQVYDETPEIPIVTASPIKVDPVIAPKTPTQSPATPVIEPKTKGPEVKAEPAPIAPSKPVPQADKPQEKPKAALTPTPPSPGPIPEQKPSKAQASAAAPKTPESPAKPVTLESPANKTATTETSVQKPEASLPLDKTQPSRTRRSPPTSDFGNDTVANNLAWWSEYNVRGYARRSEAHIVGSPRPRSRSRPLVVDEVDETRFQVEHFFCYAERMKMLGNHEHFVILSRVNSQVNHTPSDAERALIKAAPEDAPRLADAVVAEADKYIERFVKGRPLTWDEDDDLWDLVNEESTPASVGYVIMYRRAPYVFKPKEASMADPAICTMPLMGLYILLLDKEYPTSFRVNLARELRVRGSRIFPRMQKDQLKWAAFPATYMMLAYHKNPEQFMAGEEIHSQASKRKKHH